MTGSVFVYLFTKYLVSQQVFVESSKPRVFGVAQNVNDHMMVSKEPFIA